MGESGSSGSELVGPASASSEWGPPFLSLVGTKGTIAIEWVLGRLKRTSSCSESYGPSRMVAGPRTPIRPFNTSTPNRAEKLLFCYTATLSNSTSREGLSLVLKLANPTIGNSDPFANVT